jgi:superfamily II DNA or RNA helicase
VGSRFTVASLQTLWARRKSSAFRELAERTTALTVDECHTVPADTASWLIQQMRNARIRVGLSGTPLARGDNRSLVAVGVLGPIAYRIKADTLIQAGVLAKPTVRLVPLVQQSKGASWADVYRELVTDSERRNRAVLEMARRAEKPAMVFTTGVAHGRDLAKKLRQAGMNAEFVSGSASLDRRQRAVRDLASGRLDVVCATSVFNEGVDVPCLRSVVNAAGGKSGIATIQRAGRALRVEPGKSTATIWDVGDKGDRWLAQHARERVRAYQREGYPVVVDRTVAPEEG